ncbi:hypothetical protein KI387_008091, partial [Taxus chinensis]
MAFYAAHFLEVNDGLISRPTYISRHWLQALRISLGQFRVGSHRLRVEDHQLDRSERICQLCSLQEVETEEHFIFRCPIYYEIRGRFHCLFREHPSFAAFFRYCDQRCLALYLQEALKLRNETLQSPPRQAPPPPMDHGQPGGYRGLVLLVLLPDTDIPDSPWFQLQDTGISPATSSRPRMLGDSVGDGAFPPPSSSAPSIYTLVAIVALASPSFLSLLSFLVVWMTLSGLPVGEPKAIPWTHATPLKAAADAWAHMDIRSGDVVCWPTNLGWMMGPWLVYASLLNGASMAVYNGSPISTGFTKFVQDAKVTMLGLVPSLARSWKRMDCVAGLDWSKIRCFSSSGEASNVDEYLWLMGRASYKPVIEYCGGTEIGGGFVAGSMLQSQSLAAFSTPAMGCSLFILGEDGNPLPEDNIGIGELALHPSIFGASTTLLNANHYDVYFKGMPSYDGKILRRHGDEFERMAGGYYRAHGRVDDTMNLGGIKVSSIEIERVCNGVDGRVLETAAIGIPPGGGGPEQLLIVIVLKDAKNTETVFEDIKASFNSALQKKLNPLFK